MLESSFINGSVLLALSSSILLIFLVLYHLIPKNNPIAKINTPATIIPMRAPNPKPSEESGEEAE